VAAELAVPQHVLRFWESKFPQVKPMKRGGGRRYYRPQDLNLLRGIRHLLYGDGFTIRGVQKVLREQGVRFVVDLPIVLDPTAGRDRSNEFDAAYIDESIGEADGFCEPAMVRLPTGDLLVILRMGSGYPLYSVRSSDDGETWSQPEELPARSIDPKLVRMDTGILALLTGRPDVTLHLSMDDGKTWPYQATLLRSTERRSTSNTALVQVGSGKLLCVFDRFHTDETAEDYWLRMHGDGEVVGCFVDITTSDCQPVKQEQKVVRA